MVGTSDLTDIVDNLTMSVESWYDLLSLFVITSSTQPIQHSGV